jgi:Flp pilus assembly protein TadD
VSFRRSFPNFIIAVTKFRFWVSTKYYLKTTTAMKKIIIILISLIYSVITLSQNADSGKIIITDKKDYTSIKIGDSTITISHDYMAQSKLADGIQKGANGDFTGAVADFNTALLFDLDNPEIFYNRGLAYYNLKDNDQALTDFNLAIKYDSNYYLAYNQRGIIKCRQDNCFDAVNDFNTAIRLKPDYVLAYFNLGITYLQLANFTDGCIQLNKAKELGYENAGNIIDQYCK